MDSSPLKTSPRAPAQTHIVESLIDRLITGQIAPGAVININMLAREFGVSPTPVREALNTLEGSGLVVRKKPRGYLAAPLFTDAEMRQLMQARLTIELALTELAAARVDSEFIDRLEACLSREEGREPAYTSDRRLGEEFHLLIGMHADNPFLVGAYSSLGGHTERFRLQAASGSFDHEAAAREHRAILDALRERDVSGAVAAMRSHLELASARSQRDIRAAADRRGGAARP